MLRGDSPTVGVRHATKPNHIDILCGEEMPAEKTGNFHVVGRGSAAQEGAAKKCSSALATTLSTCQVPGGTSLLVGCVLGKTLFKPKQQPRGSLKRKPTEQRKEILPVLSPDKIPTSNGRGRAKLLNVPRSISINCPRIGNSNPLPILQLPSGTTMTFLFDKVASVTDCRSTGHFVLPKRKVEEHFPPISKPGGIWMTLMDASGKEWSFEFCFWHSKDSRIYYFKKFYPYVQSTDLRGGDTVFFSRVEPEGTLFMGYRKQKPAPSKVSKAPAIDAPKEVLKERLLTNGELKNPAEDGSAVLDEVAPRGDLPATSVDNVNADYSSDRVVYNRKRRMESPNPLLTQRKKVIDHLAVGEALLETKSSGRRSTTPEAFQHVDRIAGFLGSKGKRLRVNFDEYCEWEETQDLLRPPPGAVPTIVTVEGHDFEEYEEPPILIKRTFYSSEMEGENQWVKCDDCGSWRRLPGDVFVPAKWICSDNVRDSRRAHCSAPQELSDSEIDHLLGFLADTEDGTESEEEWYDDEWATPESPLAQEDECYYTKPRVWSRERALVDDSRQKHISHHELDEKYKSYMSERGSFEHVPGNALQSSGSRPIFHPNEPSAMLSARRSVYIPSGAGKGHQMCTGCDEYIGSAAQACKQCGTLTEYGARRKAQYIDGYNF